MSAIYLCNSPDTDRLSRGAVRHFDPRTVDDIEKRHGIVTGAIERFAFSSPLIDLVTTGRISRREWMAQIAEHLGNHEAAAEWEHQLFRSDPAVLDSMGVIGSEVFFTDSSPAKLAGASALGMTTHHYTGIAALERALRDGGIHIDL